MNVRMCVCVCVCVCVYMFRAVPACIRFVSACMFDVCVYVCIGHVCMYACVDTTQTM